MTNSTIASPTLALVLAAVASTLAQAAPSYDGLKKTVAVDTFQAAEAVGGSVFAEGMTAMLVAALAKDGRFVVVERAELVSLQSEQALGAAASSTSETDVEMEKIGTIRVDGVREKLSTAAIVTGVSPARGDFLKLN
jgi:curli biogenesis system outer membrane secretion channel CsgG